MLRKPRRWQKKRRPVVATVGGVGPKPDYRAANGCECHANRDVCFASRTLQLGSDSSRRRKDSRTKSESNEQSHDCSRYHGLQRRPLRSVSGRGPTTYPPERLGTTSFTHLLGPA